ncbi:ferredoxin-nitrate reductase [Pedobacter sp. UYP30]|uniref:molybdopterin-dependent oxidoreductase n=1 Tax=Pedobacter sp. UYP30 TaxID=1756400 RepID=UPI0033986E6F
MTKISSKTVQIPSTCCYCGVGCGVLVSKDKNNTLSLEGDKSHPSNEGKLCSKGLNLHYTVNDKSDRLLYPQMRYNKSMPLEKVTWDEALDRTAAVFKTFIEKYGPDSVAFYVSGQCLTEEYYLVNKLMKGFIGSNNIDTNSRLCMSSAVAAYKMSLGEDSVPLCYDDIELADCFYVTGANPSWCHPILWRRVEAHKAANPTVKIIVVDPRVTDTCSIADLHLQLNPGTDVTLNHAIGRILIENGTVDFHFINNHSEGFDAYSKKVFAKTLEESAEICGLDPYNIKLAAQYIGDAKGFISMWTMGLNQSSIGVNKNLSLINLSLITGKIGKPGNGPLSLTGQPNAMGGREVGGLSNLLAAHKDLANPLHRKEVKEFWAGTEINPKPGLTATEMFEALEDGRLKAIWIMCTNPLLSLPNVRQAEAALKKAKYVVVQEISNKSECLAYADVILPAAGWVEKEGTMTNSERRISYLPKVLDAPGQALPDAEIIVKFAQKMGFNGFDYKNQEEIFLEHAALTANTNINITGLNYKILQEERSVQWPYHSKKNQSTPRLFTDFKFYTPSQKAIIHAVADVFKSERPSPEFPLILTTGRIRDQWHTRSKTGKVSKLNQHIKQSFLEIHPADAEELNISENDLVSITSKTGEVRVKANITLAIKRGVVFLPMHYGKILNSDLNRANNLTTPLLDEISKEPDFKYCTVNVAKYQKPTQRIVVIGAGAGAFGFIKSYREVNQSDHITVFSKENNPFYNRVMLPDYISGEQKWEQLVKMTKEEEPIYNISLQRGVGIEKINREQKFVTDDFGKKTPYDLLIIATGSRAAIPKNIPKIPGIFSMRTRKDADDFKNHLPRESHVLIVGGGLLGLEMAASLRALGVKITIVQRISRFLSRQLDPLGSQILYEEMVDQGCDIYFDDEAELFYGRSKLTGVRLKSGRKIECDAVVLAIGTTPNVELAKDCGLMVKRGVVVNEYLQTSDTAIFAIGEIAEFDGILYGITAAAEQQAAVLANYLYGDIASFYQGSVFMNIIKVHGFDLCSIGLPECPNDREYEEIVFIDKAKRYYKKCIIHQDRLVGAILIGDKNEFQEYRDLISNKIELSGKRLQLLRSGKAPAPIIGKLICSCNNVGEGNISDAIANGCIEIKDLCAKTGAGTGCGSCRPEVKRILDTALVLD